MEEGFRWEYIAGVGYMQVASWWRPLGGMNQ